MNARTQDPLNDAYAEGRADALAALDAQEVCTLIRRMPLGFADLLAMVSAIECRLVEKGDRENVATEDASVRLCQAIDELGQLKDRTAEEVRAMQEDFFAEAA
jgi:hypothetical protein